MSRCVLRKLSSQLALPPLTKLVLGWQPLFHSFLMSLILFIVRHPSLNLCSPQQHDTVQRPDIPSFAHHISFLTLKFTIIHFKANTHIIKISTTSVLTFK